MRVDVVHFFDQRILQASYGPCAGLSGGGADGLERALVFHDAKLQRISSTAARVRKDCVGCRQVEGLRGIECPVIVNQHRIAAFLDHE